VVKLKYCLFINCSADRGGGFFIDVSGLSLITNFSIEYCYFENNLATSQEKNFAISGGTEEMKQQLLSLFFLCSTSDNSPGPPLFSLIPIDNLQYNVSNDPSIQDFFPCGVDDPCKSVLKAV
jgi:hypothetical protein